jgi:rhamnosyl/mannosyltransferase
VVPPEDPIGLSDAMNKLLQNPDLREAMGKEAKARYRSIFTVDRMIKSYVQLYQSVTKGTI